MHRDALHREPHARAYGGADDGQGAERPLGGHGAEPFRRHRQRFCRQCGDAPDGRPGGAGDLPQAQDLAGAGADRHRGLLQSPGRGHTGRRYHEHPARWLCRHELQRVLLAEGQAQHLLADGARRAGLAAGADVSVPQGDPAGRLRGRDQGGRLFPEQADGRDGADADRGLFPAKADGPDASGALRHAQRALLCAVRRDRPAARRLSGAQPLALRPRVRGDGHGDAAAAVRPVHRDRGRPLRGCDRRHCRTVL